MFQEAANLLSKQEPIATDEVFRLAALLRVQIALGTIEASDLEAAENLVTRGLPPSYALELQISLARTYQFQNLHEQAATMMIEALKNQECLALSLSSDQKKAFLERIKSLVSIV